MFTVQTGMGKCSLYGAEIIFSERFHTYREAQARYDYLRYRGSQCNVYMSFVDLTDQAGKEMDGWSFDDRTYS
jgi:hypothetical protein